MLTTTEELIAYAKTYLGVHYRYGGNCRLSGLDCSGFLCDVLRMVGIVELKGDYSAQTLYELLMRRAAKKTDVIGPGCILFFGFNTTNLSHVALALNNLFMIEAAGGTHRTLTFQDAADANACVKQSFIANRKNFVVSLMPSYP